MPQVKAESRWYYVVPMMRKKRDSRPQAGTGGTGTPPAPPAPAAADVPASLLAPKEPPLATTLPAPRWAHEEQQQVASCPSRVLESPTPMRGGGRRLGTSPTSAASQVVVEGEKDGQV